VHDHGGDVLKLIGDGTLAISPPKARRRLPPHGKAYNTLRGRLSKLTSAGRQEPADHRGYSAAYRRRVLRHIGSRERLDFTVVGRRSTRLRALLRLPVAERNVLVSTGFAMAMSTSERRHWSRSGACLRGANSRRNCLRSIPPRSPRATSYCALQHN